MFRFDSFVENWATVYKPMLHDPSPNGRNKRFYLTDTYMGLVDFMTNIRPNQSPCIIMESSQEGAITDRFDYPRYALYFMVQADIMSNGRAAIEAEIEAKTHMIKFINYLRHQKRMNEILHQRSGLENIKIESYLDYQPVGPFYNGWYGIQITLENLEAYSQCVISDDYIVDINQPSASQQLL